MSIQAKKRFGFSVMLFVIAVIALILLNLNWPSRTAVAQQPPGGSTVTDRIATSRYFPEPLLWVGLAAPNEIESRLLEDILKDGKQNGSYQATAELEAFLTELPDSPWAVSLRSNLGYYYRVRGRYTRALELWRAAWAATRHFESGAGRRVADYTLIHWAQLLASLGRVEELEMIMAETQGRRMSLLSWQHQWNKSQGALAVMKRRPEISYRCGTLALMRVGRLLGVKTIASGELAEIPSPSTGFSIASLLDLAREREIQVEAVERMAGEELVVPSVIHWKQNHYAALVERRGDLCLVEDPTFGGPQWLRADVINEEASGYFLVPANQRPTGWRVLSKGETELIYGKGMNSADPPPPPPPCPEDGQDECDCAPPPPPGPPGPPPGCITAGCGSQSEDGMPSWEVKEPYISLWLHDRPMRYLTSLGTEIELKLKHHQRETRPADGDVFNFGPYWNCNWLTYLDVTDYVDDPQLEYYNATLYGSGGGERSYKYWITNPEYRSRTRLERIVNQSALTGFKVIYPNGSEAVYGLLVEVSSAPQRTLAFLTGRLDAQGRATQFVYSTANDLVRLTQVIDADGRTNVVRYAGANDTRVEEIENPDGHLVQFRYNQDGLLTNLVDVVGISSSFEYTETNGIFVLTKLTTPYGETAFGYFRPTAGLYQYTEDDDINRAITVTQPDGGKHLFMYRDNSEYLVRDQQQINLLPYCYADRPTNLPVSGYCDDYSSWPPADLCNHNVYYRNSFYWGPLQYSALSSATITQLSTNDYRLARLRNWLHAWGLDSVSETLNLQREPTPDGLADGQATWFGYTNKSYWHWEGTDARPSYTARVLPNGETQYTYREYNAQGHTTLDVTTWTDGASVATRTNTFIYAGNGIDLVLQIGPTGEQVVSNYFGNSYHQVDASYDALNQETRFAYNANRQLTSLVRPGGLTTTNIYFASGDNENRLDKTIDLEINRTNSYTWYSSGNVQTHTDERRLTTTNYWDALNRLTGVLYPDGTTTTNLYAAGSTKILDLTATKDRLGHWTYFGYDGVRRKIAETNANSVVNRYGYCDCGTLLSVTNAWNTPAQFVTSFGYDNQGNRIYTTYPDMTITNWYDSLRRPIVTGDAWGYRWLYYNNQGLLTTISNVFGVEQHSIFDIDDHPIYVTDANSVTITNTYDDLDRLRTRGYPDGGVERFGYSARGLVAYTNQLGFTNFFAYDAAGRKTFETNANWELIRYTNNAADDLLSLTDGKNQTTRWNYDEYGRVTNKLDQAGVEVLRYQYDPNSRLTNRWSKAKAATKYMYDPVGNLTNVDYAVSTDVKFQYDPLNRVTNMVDAVGTTKYAYTAGGQLWTEDGPFSSDTVTNIYSSRLRTNLSLAQPTGQWTNRFGYDAAKRLTNVTSPAGSFTYTLGAAGAASPLVKKLSLPNTSYITNHYDSVARLLFTKLNNSSHTTLNRHEYVLNTAHQRTQQTFTDSSTYDYTCDKIGQLKVADGSVSSHDRGYNYDTAWNLSHRTNSVGVTPFSVNGKNELTSGPNGNYAYDANGNLTNYYSTYMNYAYDDENQLTSWQYVSTARTEYVYDGRGRLRVRKDYSWAGFWMLNTETRYTYDGMRVIQERNNSSIPLVSYTRGTDLSGSLEDAGGIGGMLARSHGYASTNGNWYTHNSYHADGNGNITYLVNSSQTLAASYRYDPYGNTIAQSGTLGSVNKYRFSSKELMAGGASGIYYYGYRFYDPNLQRWPNRDPFGEPGHELLRSSHGRDGTTNHELLENVDSSEPWDLNDYAFVSNDPMTSIDPLGLFKKFVGPCNASQRQGCIAKCQKEKKLMLSCQRITVTLKIRGIPIPFSRTVCVCADPKKKQPLPPPPDPACDVSN